MENNLIKKNGGIRIENKTPTKSLNLYSKRKSTMNKIKDLLKLSVEERIHLVQSIWDSVAAEAEASEVDEEHKSILDKRIEAHQDDPHEVVSWEEIKKNAKKSM